MVWNFLKIAIFVTVIAALTFGAAFLSSSGGAVRLTLSGMEYTLGPLQAVLALLVLFVVLWAVLTVSGLVVAFVRFLNGDDSALRRYFDRNRERKGYRALSEGMMALASGEPKAALAQAAKAERYLDSPELTTLLVAQAAEAAGDRYRASEAYKRLLTHPQSRFIGVRGLMNQKIAEGDTETALKLAEKAFALKPRDSEVQDALLALQSQKGDWKGARNVLGAKARQGLLPKDVHRRRDAVMALQEARALIDKGASIETREAAIAANKASPDLIPAAAMAARAYIADGRPKYATRVLVKAWEAQPHPDLATAFAEIAPSETPQERLRRFGALLKVRPEHPETVMLAAELHIAAEDFPGARRAMGTLVETAPTARALTIMAAIERGEGKDDAVVRGWLTRALTASRGPQWVCDKCHQVSPDWSPVCPHCNGFDTLSWRELPQGAVPMPHGADMLPLIVGKPQPDPEPAQAAEVVEPGAKADAPPPESPHIPVSSVIEERQGDTRARPFAVDYAEPPENGKG